MKLLEPIQIGRFTLKNRVAMAPLTRSRADAHGVQGPLAAEYYAQRAGAGLIISEATCISQMGRGYPRVPGVWSDEQIEAWKPVPKAVHDAGGVMILQLWHTGRIGHESLQPGGPVSSSDVALGSEVTGADMQKHMATQPRPLTVDEIKSTVEDYVRATENALKLGFDGVQVHGANGYLIDQFLRDGVNLRTDSYGGSRDSRCRFLVEVMDAVLAVAGDSLVSLRLSPTNNPGNEDSDYHATWLRACELLKGKRVDLLEIREGNAPDALEFSRAMADAIGCPVCSNQGYTAESGEFAVHHGSDMVAYGVPYIANPDLVERFRLGAALNEPRRDSFYYGGAEGYTDYPFLSPAGV